MAAVKKGDRVAELVTETKPHGAPLTKFHSYDLDELKIPEEARPRVGEVHTGKHGYTLRSSSGAALCLHTKII